MAIDDMMPAGWVARLRADEPEALAVLLCGSLARGDAGPHSDVDFTVLIPNHKEPAPYRALLVEMENDRLLHVSIGAERLGEWLADREAPAPWSFAMPARQETRVLWAAESVRERLAYPSIMQPAAPPELEDFVENFDKLKNARASGDELVMRLAAHDLARLCPSVLLLLNRQEPLANRSAALRAALELAVAPPDYRQDMLACLGLSGQAIPLEALYAGALHLVIGTIDLLAGRLDELGAAVEPDLRLYLADGRLKRYVLQDT